MKKFKNFFNFTGFFSNLGMPSTQHRTGKYLKYSLAELTEGKVCCYSICVTPVEE
jgi:hypothetical protein